MIKFNEIRTTLVIVSTFLFSTASIYAQENTSKTIKQEQKDIILPAPSKKGGKPLMEALALRKTSRDFTERELSPQTLSNLLWAAFGINRPETKGRTAPSARNTQEIDIYVAMKNGLFLYSPVDNTLKLIASEDLRSAAGSQDFVGVAPVNFIYVSDFSKMGSIGEADRDVYTGINVGYISQNVYLFCASEGLSTVARGLIDKEKLAPKLKLNNMQKIVLAQTVGYPKK